MRHSTTAFNTGSEQHRGSVPLEAGMECPNCWNIRRELHALREKLIELKSLIDKREITSACSIKQPESSSEFQKRTGKAAKRVIPPQPNLPHALSPRDELFHDAVRIVTEFGNASPSVLQLWLSISYSRARDILKQLEDSGFIAQRKGLMDLKVLPAAYIYRENLEGKTLR